MNHGADEILLELGYSLAIERMQLPMSSRKPSRMVEIQQQIEELLPLVQPANEASKRETLITPIVMEITRFLHCQLRIEYPLTVNNWLKGEIDYLLRSTSSLTVI